MVLALKIKSEKAKSEGLQARVIKQHEIELHPSFLN